MARNTFSTILMIISLFSGTVLADENKLNMYYDIADCQADRNATRYVTPEEGTCHELFPGTNVVYLAVADSIGSLHNGAGGMIGTYTIKPDEHGYPPDDPYFTAWDSSDCDYRSEEIPGNWTLGECIMVDPEVKAFHLEKRGRIH